jgi:hypothetical protein
MKNLCAWFILLFLEVVRMPAEASEVLQYEPSEVKVRGIIRRQIFPGAPNYEDITKGDEPELQWMLHLKQPVDVADCIPPDEIDRARKNVRQMQLVFHVLNNKTHDDFRDCLEKPVIVTGQLFGTHTGHHRTDVLLKVRDIAPDVGDNAKSAASGAVR